MTMLAVGIALWTFAIILLMWLAARRKAAEPQALTSARAQVEQARVDAQKDTLQEIADDVQRFDLADYVNDKPRT